MMGGVKTGIWVKSGRGVIFGRVVCVDMELRVLDKVGFI